MGIDDDRRDIDAILSIALYLESFSQLLRAS